MFTQVLTLASNERVPLTPSMRLMFEIGHLKAATPATVSRAGILFANPSDLGWNPYVTLLPLASISYTVYACECGCLMGQGVHVRL